MSLFPIRARRTEPARFQQILSVYGAGPLPWTPPSSESEAGIIVDGSSSPLFLPLALAEPPAIGG